MVKVAWKKEDYFYDYNGLEVEFYAPEQIDTPDYTGYWLKFDTWTEGEAIFLLHNVCASVLQWGGLDVIIERMLSPRKLKKAIEETRAILRNSLISKTFFVAGIDPIRFEKKAFIKWAHSKGFEIPEPLKHLLHEPDTPPQALPAYLDPKFKGGKFYAPELALAVEAWQAVFEGEQKPGKLTPKKRIEKYLKDHPQANDNKRKIARLSAVCNPRKANGRK
jgi:hypothetical protein